MKKHIISLILIFISFQVAAQSIYVQPLNDINGNVINLKKYLGKKMVFIIVPISTVDSSTIKEVDSFLVSCGEKAAVFGIPSIEDGYTESQKVALQQIYTGKKIILSEGMYTKKASGSNQSPIMQWLTHQNKNFRSDADAAGPGQAFFVADPGNLLFVARPEASLNIAGTLFIINKPPGH